MSVFFCMRSCNYGYCFFLSTFVCFFKFSVPPFIAIRHSLCWGVRSLKIFFSICIRKGTLEVWPCKRSNISVQFCKAWFVCSCQIGSIPRHKSQFCRTANLFVCLYIHGRICSICLYLSSLPAFSSKLVSCHQLSLSLSQQRLLPFPTKKVLRWYILPGLNHSWRGE